MKESNENTRLCASKRILKKVVIITLSVALCFLVIAQFFGILQILSLVFHKNPVVFWLLLAIPGTIIFGCEFVSIAIVIINYKKQGKRHDK
ncbi:hypothetical protein QUF80_11025 [Desulfococcaceae bacterium HSG8]|nr:hypothetical protein [Desulfococcaceae bacterium HSG8]